MAKKQIIVSGIQPTGNLHIGNYLGAVKNWVDLQNSGKYDCYFFIADLHSLTGNRNSSERKAQILRTAAELLAAGIDPKKSTFFVQSHVPEHTELAWIFNCVTPIAELERMTQFKDKSQSQAKNINVGLFTYPALMAADILLYHASAVPVGQDQTQHAELTNDIVRWFTKNYGSYFFSVKPIFTETPKIMSLLEPMKKMSKSLGEGHVIELADEPEVIEKKLKKAVTATEGGAGSPGVENLLGLLRIFGDAALYKQFHRAEKDGTIRYGDLKMALAGVIGETFADFRERRDELMRGHDEVADILAEGMEKAQPIAEKTMHEVRKMVGIR